MIGGDDILRQLLHVGIARRQRLIEYILDRVEVDPVTGCWNWTGPTSGPAAPGKTGRDYARGSVEGQTVAVHRALWQLVWGFLPSKKQLDHQCRNRRCVNPFPDHNLPATHKQNCKARDRARKELAS